MTDNPLRARAMPQLLAIALALLLAHAASLFAPPGAGAASSGGISSFEPPDDGDANVTPTKYDRIWDGLATPQRRWARSTSECESGGDPDAIGGGGLYRGAFQFMRSTWKHAPRTPGGDPIDYSYRTQAVVAVLLKKRDGAGHWPNCG
jgi:hypothetical protein